MILNNLLLSLPVWNVFYEKQHVDFNFNYCVFTTMITKLNTLLIDSLVLGHLYNSHRQGDIKKDS